MSAIWGIINKDGKPVDPEMVQKIRHRMQHRAKHGSKELVCGNAAFGFCHLVVYPNQEHEQLPIEDGDLVFTANAHLHNREELVNKLGFDKKQYAATPDSYLILAAYKKWGAECVHHLDGEYVYAIWNKLSQQLFISNDHIGYKALYYYDTPEQFIFCSEIKGIEAVKESPNVFDEESLAQYLLLNSEITCTYNKEIKALLGNSIALLTEGRLSVIKYWQLRAVGRYAFTKDEDWYDCIRSYFLKAIGNRLNTDVPVGIQLSGGLDSSSIACVLASILKTKNKALYAFSSVLPNKYLGKREDEKKYIEIVHRHCPNIIQHDVHAQEVSPYEGIDKTILANECFPALFHYMDMAIITEAKQRGIKIMYTGIGGDHWVSAQGKMVIHKLVTSGKLQQSFNLLKQFYQKEGSWWEVIKKELLYQSPVINWYAARKTWHIKNCLQPRFRENRFKRSLGLEKLGSMPSRVTSGEGGRLLQLFDTRHEGYGMVSANPCLDKNLLEALVEVPSALFVRGGVRRSLFRNAMTGILPPEIQWRKTKSDYVVDGVDRIIAYKEAMREVIFGQSPVMKQYFLEQQVEKILSRATFETASSDQLRTERYYLSMMALASHMTSFLKQQGYQFNENK